MCIESSILLCSALCVCLCVLLIQIIGISYPTSLKVSTLETLALLSGGEGKEGFRLAKGKKAEEDSVGLYIQNIEKGKDEEEEEEKTRVWGVMPLVVAVLVYRRSSISCNVIWMTASNDNGGVCVCFFLLLLLFSFVALQYIYILYTLALTH